jgi:hypothetical protein
MWLVGLGRAAYERVVAKPDSLATVPAVQRLASLPQPWEDDDYPTSESLEYVACEVGDQPANIDGHIRDVVTEERGVTCSHPKPNDVDHARLAAESVACFALAQDLQPTTADVDISDVQREALTRAKPAIQHQPGDRPVPDLRPPAPIGHVLGGFRRRRIPRRRE